MDFYWVCWCKMEKRNEDSIECVACGQECDEVDMYNCPCCDELGCGNCYG